KTNEPGKKSCLFRSLYAVYRYGRGNDTYRFSRSGGCSYFHRSWSWWLRSWSRGKWLRGKECNIGYRIENERYADEQYGGHTIKLSRTTGVTRSLAERTNKGNKLGA